MPLYTPGLTTGGVTLTNGSVLFSNGTNVAQDNANFFWDDTNNRLGIGTTSPSFPLEVARIDTSTSGTINNISSALTINAATASATIYRSIFGQTLNASAQTFSRLIEAGHFENRWTGGGSATSTVAGAVSYGMILGSATINFGTLAEVVGAYVTGVSSFSNTATGTITVARGLRVLNSTSTTQTLTGQAGVSIDALSGATNNTAILIGTGTVAAGNFGIYNVSTNNNYFAGNVGIGTTTPSQALYVNSTTNAGGIYSDGTANPSFSLLTSGTLRGLFGAVTSAGAYSTDSVVGDVVYQTKGGKFIVNTNSGTGSSSLAISSGNVGIGTTAPSSTAILDLTSTTLGFLKPRMTSTQRTSITTPAAGLEVYDSTVSKPYYYNGSAWVTNTPTAPSIQKFTSGSGTYTTPAGVLYIKVRMVGGGGGGGGGGASVGGTGGTGGTTTFGSSLLTCVGGTGGAWAGAPGLGGAATLSAPAVGTAMTGGGGSGYISEVATTGAAASAGASSPFGGAGAGGNYNTAGGNGATNSGSGGGGGGSSNSAACYTGASGGAGAYIDALITSPSATYAYAVGAAGTAGTAGTAAYAGGAGGSGYIEVMEFYQ